MKKRKLVGLVAGLSVLLVCGGLYASNMVFKFDYTLRGNDTSLTGQTTLALPYCQETSLVNANDLITDIGGTGVVQLIARFTPANNGKIAYSGTAGAPFPLVAGEGYFVELKPGVPTRNYVIAGSHDPSVALILLGQTSGAAKSHMASLNGTNFVAIPANTIAKNASEIIVELGTVTARPGTEVVQQVARVRPDNTLESYTGTAGTPFLIAAGEAYFVQLKPGQPDITWFPSHY